MVRSMYSGVSGMKAHQTRMDVIGNNIANVNTYGYKASRATFRDMFYQNIRNAAAGTATRGGLSPSSIGYGSSISSVDIINMGPSTMSSTGNPLDVSITGEGFFQVMDNDGNVFYTKAGMLDIDNNGNLIDTNGYFVLGTAGSPTGKPAGSDKIKFAIPSVTAATSSYTGSINGMQYTINASNYTTAGDVSFNFQSRTDMPIGENVQAILNGPNITINLNATTTFADLADLQAQVNAAITKANKGLPHAGGDFKFTMSDSDKFDNLTGAEICGNNFGYKKGSVTIPDSTFGGIKVSEVGDLFSASGTTALRLGYTAAVPAGAPEQITVTLNVGGIDYSCTMNKTELGSGKSAILNRIPPVTGDTITVNMPGWDTVIGARDTGTNVDAPTWTSVTSTEPAVASTPSKDLGFGDKPLILQNGTEGGSQSLKDLTSIAIGADGKVIATHGILGELEIGRIDIATFDNPRGLQLSGNSYFVETPSSGEPALAVPGENGTGTLLNNTLELSNVDLSQEFSDMITTQRGFQANSRLITVSDTMLEELINLKR